MADAEVPEAVRAYVRSALADASAAQEGLTEDMLALSGIVLIFLMQAGFLMLEAGAVRVKNASNIVWKNFVDVAVGCALYLLIGYTLAAPGGNAFAGDAVPLLHDGGYLSFTYSFVFAATTSTIVSGAVAERCAVPGYLALNGMIVTIVYPIVSHWVWTDEGWLSPSNANPLLDVGLVDIAGSGVVHLVGGVSSVVAAYTLGPRIGRFADEHHEKAQLMRGHSIVFQALGTLLLWTGWFYFNSSSSTSNAGLVVANTLLGGGGGALCAMVLTYQKSGGVLMLSPIMNGSLGGLVSITAGCAVTEPYGALLIGACGGALVVHGEDVLERLRIDDPLQASVVHGACGLWGLLSVGLFATREFVHSYYGADADDAGIFYGGTGRLFAVQIIGAVVIVVWTASLMGGTCLLAKHYGLLRVSVEDEERGLDESKHGGSAYPAYLERVLNIKKELQARLEHAGVLSALGSTAMRHAGVLPLNEVTRSVGEALGARACFYLSSSTSGADCSDTASLVRSSSTRSLRSLTSSMSGPAGDNGLHAVSTWMALNIDEDANTDVLENGRNMRCLLEHVAETQQSAERIDAAGNTAFHVRAAHMREELKLYNCLAVPIVLYTSEDAMKRGELGVTGVLLVVGTGNRSFDLAAHYFVQSVAQLLGQSIIMQLQQRWNEAAHQASEKSKLDFLSMMSHEMLTPLHGVNGAMELLRDDGALNEAQLEHADEVEKSAARLGSLVNTMLEYSALDASSFSLELSSVHPLSIAEATVARYQIHAQQAGLDLLCTSTPEAHMLFEMDPERVSQVLGHVVENAIKFSTADSESVVVHVSTSAHDGSDCVCFSVTDQGVGISAEDKISLFRVFSQVDTSITRAHGGTGMGLPLCKRLVTLMDGDLGIESVRGEGSTVWFTVAHKRAPKAFDTWVPGTSETSVAVRSPKATVVAALRSIASLMGYAVQDDAASADVVLLDAALAEESRKARGRFVCLTRAAGELPAGSFVAHTPLPLTGTALSNVLGIARSCPPTEPQATPRVKKSNSGLGVAGGWSHLHVLCCEDDATNRRLLRLFLRKLKISNVVFAEDGQIGVDRFRKESGMFDLILMDLHMPNVSGFDATQTIRALEDMNGHAVPIVALTADHTHGVEERCRSVGMTAFLHKPFKRDLLVRTLEDLGL